MVFLSPPSCLRSIRMVNSQPGSLRKKAYVVLPGHLLVCYFPLKHVLNLLNDFSQFDRRLKVSVVQISVHFMKSKSNERRKTQLTAAVWLVRLTPCRAHCPQDLDKQAYDGGCMSKEENFRPAKVLHKSITNRVSSAVEKASNRSLTSRLQPKVSQYAQKDISTRGEVFHSQKLTIQDRNQRNGAHCWQECKENRRLSCATILDLYTAIKHRRPQWVIVQTSQTPNFPSDIISGINLQTQEMLSQSAGYENLSPSLVVVCQNIVTSYQVYPYVSLALV